MFKVGEKVVYPAHGVGEIEAIRSHVISGTEKKFYMLRILETDMKIMIPIDNVESVGLRKIIDRAMVMKVYKVLRQKKVETDQQTWNRRYREYTEKIKTGSILEIAKVLREIKQVPICVPFGYKQFKILPRYLLFNQPLPTVKSNHE